MNPLLVNAAELLRRPGNDKNLAFEVTAEELGLVESRVESVAPVGVAIHLESLSTGLVVTGEVSVPWADTCRRCLAPVGGLAVAEINELYQLQVTVDDAFPIVGDQIDLGEAVREALLLELPVAPLCRSDCAGLCPQCGVDRNEDPCSCEMVVVDDRWAALDSLRDRLN